MHTIIKIAVVSVLSLFAIVGLVSISKAEETVWYCEMTEFLEVEDEKVTNYKLEKFKFKVSEKVIKFGSGGFLDLVTQPVVYFRDENMFRSESITAKLNFKDGLLNYASVAYEDIFVFTAKCDKF